jgi:hypothetical protein
VVPATQEAEAGESLEFRSLRSAGQQIETPYKKINEEKRGG